MTTTNTGLAKVAVQCSADTFVVNQSLALRINICGNKPALRKSAQPVDNGDFKRKQIKLGLNS
ncbi:MAG: hypothetical protein ORN54_12625, partial [Cyclobacteriaceae bacterium]|nr:hypothetical protein [Cyclobacteriaceae bacterium]